MKEEIIKKLKSNRLKNFVVYIKQRDIEKALVYENYAGTDRWTEISLSDLASIMEDLEITNVSEMKPAGFKQINYKLKERYEIC